MPDATLTRRQFARAIGTSEPTVRRMERRGELVPKVGTDGVRRFDVQAIDAVRTRTRTRTVSFEPPIDGVTAASVFRALSDGVSATAIVIRHGLAPDTVERLAAQYARMGGGLVITPATRHALAAPDLLGTEPAIEADLLDAVRRAAAPPRCFRCRRAPAVEGPCPKCRKAIRSEKAWTGQGERGAHVRWPTARA